jgi:molybdopterin converting factor small subunit
MTISAPASITSSRRTKDEGEIFRLGARTDRQGWLAGRDEAYAHAFAAPKAIRAAIDHAHVKPDAMIADAREIAFFPPMTGG